MPRTKGAKNKTKAQNQTKPIDKEKAIVQAMKTILEELKSFLEDPEIDIQGTVSFLVVSTPVQYGSNDSWLVGPEHKNPTLIKAIEPIIRAAGFIHKTEIPALTSKN